MARRAPLKATGEPRAPTFNTSELLQTGRASPGWAWTRSGRRLTGTFGRPGGKLLSEHIEVESGKNNDRQQLQPCHLARLARNQVRFGLRQAVKENLLWVRTFDTIEELRQALLAFRETYNDTWLVERHGFLSPTEYRKQQLQPLAQAA